MCAQRCGPAWGRCCLQQRRHIFYQKATHMQARQLWLLLPLLWLTATACGDRRQAADVIYYDGRFYTVDEKQPWATAVAIRDGHLLAVGDSATVFAHRGDSTRLVALGSAFAMPGFIEGHAHFSGLGSSLQQLNFLQATSWQEIVAQVAARAAETPPGQWISGRGWHQEKWLPSQLLTIDGYPYHDALSAVTPDHPVILRHASGHSLFANAKAMELAGIGPDTPDPAGGRIVRDSRGRAIGVFEERAMEKVSQAYERYRSSLSPEALAAEWQEGIDLATAECLRKGVTSFQDAGASFEEIERYAALADAGRLDVRLWVMIRRGYREMAERLARGGFPIIDRGGETFTCRAIKSELDGALGAFGAWMLRPYSDNPDVSGQNTTRLSTVDSIAALALRYDLQLCVHAIGDRANRVFLDMVERLSAKEPRVRQLRWRSEHAQHLDTADIKRFAQLGVIASMQGVHCTSDAPFVTKRLGEERARAGAYAWRSLLDAGAVVSNGTDAPVEDVDPLRSFYATVTRRRPDTGLIFYPEQALTRAEAIYSYTLAPAYAAFEEQQKGSLQPGKLADIVVLSNDLLACADEEILQTKVLMTIVGGEVKYKLENQ